MNVSIVPFAAATASHAEWARYHAYRALRHRETDPDDPLWDDATIEAWMRRGEPHWEVLRLAVLDPSNPDAQIGEVSCETSKPGTPPHELNRHLASVNVQLLRPYRRRGIGRTLLARGVALAESRGRSAMESWAEEDDGKTFAQAIGAKVVQNRYENRLVLDDVDWAMVERWAAEGAARSPSTKIEWFRDGVPAEIVEEYARAFTEVFNQQPFGEGGSFRGIVVTPDVFRNRAELNAEVGGTWLGAYTQERDGEVSGLTEMFYVPADATMLGQGLTGVRMKHRGRGLGKWVKAAMLLRARAGFPQARVVRTGNATENAAMLSINDRLGFRPHKRPVIVEASVETVKGYLARVGTGKA